MDWFKKERSDDALKLPEPPRLPELPRLDDSDFSMKDPLPQLPSYPQSSFGDKFSKNAIKDAVSGGEEDEEVDADDSMPDMRMMPKPPKFSMETKFNPNFQDRKIKPFMERRNIPIEDYESPRTREMEPVFVRLDKFNESLKIFQEAQSRISEIESVLSDIKRKRSEEDRQLGEWEKEMQNLKNQFEKISKNVFSKVR